MKYINQPFRQKERLLKGNQNFEVTDNTLKSNLSGRTTGKIIGSFRISQRNANDVQEVLCSFTEINSALVTNYSRVEIRSLSLGNWFGFRLNVTTGALLFYINPTILSYTDLIDDKLHTYEIIVDGINNRIIVDNITYQNTDLIFATGSKTTALFIPTNLNSMIVGGNLIWSGGVLQGVDFQPKGLIPTLQLTDLSDNNLYSFESDGDTFSASHTVYNDNNLLDLTFNNAPIQNQLETKTLTPNGTITFEEGLFGESANSAVFDVNDYYSFVNTENVEKYSVIGWIKINSNDLAIRPFLFTNDNAIDRNGDLSISLIPSTSGLRVLVTFANDNITIDYYDFPLNLEPFKYHHIAALFDSINKVVDVWVNGKYVNKSLNIATNTDLSKVHNLSSATYYIGGQDIQTSAETDCSIYDFVFPKYLLTAEEIVEHFKTTKRLLPAAYRLYKLDDNAASTTVLDYSPYLINAVATKNTSLFSFDDAERGRVFKFSTGDYFVFANPNTASYEPSPTFRPIGRTTNMHVKPTSFAVEQALFSVDNTAGGVIPNFVFIISTLGQLNIYFSGYYTLGINTQLTLNEWTQITLVEELSNFKIYFDKVLVRDYTNTIGRSANRSNYYFGKGYQRNYTGYMSDVSVFDRVLTQNEINLL